MRNWRCSPPRRRHKNLSDDKGLSLWKLCFTWAQFPNDGVASPRYAIRIGGAANPLAMMGQTYVRFAAARPGRFRLMYGRAIPDRSKYPELESARMASVDAMRAAIASSPQAIGEPAVASLRLWCMVHGLSQLILDGMLAGHDADTLARALTSGSFA